MDKRISIIHAIAIIILTGSIYILTKPEHNTHICFRILWMIAILLTTIIAIATIITIHAKYLTAKIYKRAAKNLERVTNNYRKSEQIRKKHIQHRI